MNKKQDKILDSVLLTPMNISHPVPIYNARGRVTGYGVVMRYYIGKMFMYSPLSDKKTEIDNAMQWVCNMQENGYKLVTSPKIHDTPKSGCFDLYMLCDYCHRFKELPFFNAGARAWRFWLKNQGEVSRNQRDQGLMQAIVQRIR